MRKGPNSRLQPKSVWVILVLSRTSSSFPVYFCSPGSSGRSRAWKTVLMMLRINIKMHLGQKACYFVSKVLSRLISKPNLSTSLYCGLPELWTPASMCTDGSQLHLNLSFSHKWTHSSDVELLLQVQVQAENIKYNKGLCDCGGKCSCPHSEGKKADNLYLQHLRADFLQEYGTDQDLRQAPRIQERENNEAVAHAKWRPERNCCITQTAGLAHSLLRKVCNSWLCLRDRNFSYGE